ncbi:ribonuclease-III-like-domain-containing protein [Peziza echinospora]|nr:ribonuclease-III-like-domain-containing protein [Peziza echinospora]
MASGSPLRPVLTASLSCARCIQPHLRRQLLLSAPSRSLHQSQLVLSEAEAAAETSTTPSIKREYSLPRTSLYEHTRPQPRAPHRVRAPAQEFKVNDSLEALDNMYERLFGRGKEGVALLPEDLRWQAVTHLSFDHGRQPFNNKLAFMGRRIVFYHVNIHLLNQKPANTPLASSDPETPATVSSDTQTYLAPVPFTHPDYKNIDGATYEAVGELTAENHLGDYARLAGIPQVMRWKPMNPSDMLQSGQEGVAIECLYAIIGAVGLTRGGQEAGKVVQRILASRSQV